MVCFLLIVCVVIFKRQKKLDVIEKDAVLFPGERDGGVVYKKGLIKNWKERCIIYSESFLLCP